MTDGTVIWKNPTGNPAAAIVDLEGNQVFGLNQEGRVFFTMRLECRHGSWVLNRLETRCAEWLSHVTGRGGELIAIVRKSQTA